jgi:hypothetical protein
VLGIDRDNEEAQRYHTLADKALSKIQIRQVVERQRLAEEQKDLLAFLSDIAPEPLKAKKKNDATFLFNNFDEIRSHISNLSIEFGDSDHADVGFSHMLVAVDKRTKKKRVLFEGKKTLKMFRKKKTWKIMGYD